MFVVARAGFRSFSVAALLTLAACGDSATTPDRSPSALDGQAPSSAVVARALAEPLRVRVTDASGAPISGAAVTWTVVSGGGALTSTSPVTDASGVATAAWTPGRTAGDGLVTATVGGLVYRFAVELQADAPANMTVLAGAEQEGVVGSELATPFTLQVRDQYGNGVRGAAIRWRTQSTDAGDVLFDAVEQTDFEGKGYALFRLGSEAGERTVSAAVAGAGDVMFKITGTLPPPPEATGPDTLVFGVRTRR